MADDKKSARPRLSAPTINAQQGKGDSDARVFDLGSLLADRYRILELIGEGGMGAVYRARDLTLGEDVAIKLLDPELASDDERVAYFRNEVLLARRVTHPNVCRLHDIACEDGHWFITMEFIDGESLADRLQREDSPPTEDFEAIERIFNDVAEGLAAAHAVGVVHRDLKPANVLISARTGRAVVADFGIAVELNQLGHAAVDRAGTRGYMSPEQAAGADIDARTDVFALGVLGHRLIAGEIPWIAPTRLTSTDVGGPAPAVPTGVPERLSNVIARCLERDPADRPNDASRVLELLNATAQPRASRRRKWLWAAAAATALCALAAAGLYAQRQQVPLTFAAPRVVIEEVDASGLESRLAWYDEAFARRLTNELVDAWGVTARSAGDPGEPARTSDASARVALRRGGGGELVAQLSVRRHGQTRTVQVGGETFQALAEATARELIDISVPRELQRPHAIELERSGVANADAWRLWQRAQRASLRQEWPRSRLYSERALESDPDCIPCLIELSWSYGASDRARLAPQRRAVELAETRDLSLAWVKVTNFVRADLAGDVAQMRALIGEVLEEKWPFRYRRYLSYRAYARTWFVGRRDAALPRLELHVEKFPQTSGVAKLLAEHYLDLDGDEEARLALRYAKHAVAKGADDLAARSQLARALLRHGRREEALAQVAIIESADPEEKQQAVAGGERTNSLFDLHMALDDYAGAAQAARRLYNGSPQQQGVAAESLAYLAHLRGDRATGDRLHRKAIEGFGISELTEFSTTSTGRRIWIHFALGECGEVATMIQGDDTLRRGNFAVLLELCLYRTSGRRMHLRRAEQAAAAMSQPLETNLYGLLVAAERGDWDVVLEYEDVVRSGRRWIVAYWYLGVAAEKTGNLERAVEWHELLAGHRFAWIEPIRSGDSRLEAARLREQLGDHAAARRHYETYIRLLDQAPSNHPGVAEAKKRLTLLKGERRSPSTLR